MTKDEKPFFRVFNAGQSMMANGHHVTSTIATDGSTAVFTLDGELVDEKGLNAAGFYLDGWIITMGPPKEPPLTKVRPA
jgi:hypothetical protein